MTTHKEALTLALEALELIAFFKLQPDSIQSFVNHYTPRIKEALMSLQDGAQPEQLERLQLIHKADIDLAKKRATEAQPEQEPVAYIHRNEYNEYRLEPHDNFDIKSIPFNVDVSLFKSPQRTWVGLMDEEIEEIFNKSAGYGRDDFRSFAKSIEAKLKEKNT